MNVQLKDITVTARDGRVSHLEQVYIRGSHVRYFIVPDMLRYDSQFHCVVTYAKHMIGMRPCSDREARGVAVLVLRVVGRQSTGQGLALAVVVAVAESYKRIEQEYDMARYRATQCARTARKQSGSEGSGTKGRDRYATRSLLLDIR